MSILCINGSDSMGYAGIQADIRTIKDLGGYAVTAVTSVTAQNSQGIAQIHNLPSNLVIGQIRAIYEETHPQAVKIGMVNDPETIRGIRHEVVGCRHIICSPVFLASHGGLLMSNESLHAYCKYLFPICSLLIIKCIDAEIILGRRIATDNDMREAARCLHNMGAENVLLRGGTYSEGRINALLYLSATEGEEESFSFFSSINIEGWQKHGVGGTLSTAIALRLAMGDSVAKAVSNAHDYLHTQIVYSTQRESTGSLSVKQTDTKGTGAFIYNRFMTLLTNNYATSHEVTFYASELCISTRYLSQITGSVCNRSPKQIIDEYITQQAEQLLRNTPLTIQQIAIELGFVSQVAFTKFFRNKKGCPPKQYRNH